MSEKKDEIDEEVHVKHAENIILSQIKDYYESKLKDAEQHISKNELKANYSIMARKVKKTKLRSRKESTSQKVFEPPQNELT